MQYYQLIDPTDRKDRAMNNNEVFVVLDGSKLAGVYRYREDAASHAQACGGNYVVQLIRNEIPVWVQTMIDSAKEKARLQNSVRQ